MGGLSKSERLRKNFYFRRLFQEGSYKKGKWLYIYYRENSLTVSRLGISIAKAKVKKNVLKNRLKRYLREAFRLSKEKILPGYDLLVGIRVFPAASNLGYPEISADFLELLGASGLIP